MKQKKFTALINLGIGKWIVISTTLEQLYKQLLVITHNYKDSRLEATYYNEMDDKQYLLRGIKKDKIVKGLYFSSNFLKQLAKYKGNDKTIIDGLKNLNPPINKLHYKFDLVNTAYRLYMTYIPNFTYAWITTEYINILKAGLSQGKINRLIKTMEYNYYKLLEEAGFEIPSTRKYKKYVDIAKALKNKSEYINELDENDKQEFYKYIEDNKDILDYKAKVIDQDIQKNKINRETEKWNGVLMPLKNKLY